MDAQTCILECFVVDMGSCGTSEQNPEIQKIKKNQSNQPQTKLTKLQKLHEDLNLANATKKRTDLELASAKAEEDRQKAEKALREYNEAISKKKAIISEIKTSQKRLFDAWKKEEEKFLAGTTTVPPSLQYSAYITGRKNLSQHMKELKEMKQ